MRQLPTLYTFNISHFSEKARWALDYEGIEYTEKVLLPGPHLLVTRRMARTQVPVLEHDGGHVQGSSAIVDYIADHMGGTKLTPLDEAERAKVRDAENTLDRGLGRGLQQILYSSLLEDRPTVTRLWSSGGPFWAPAFYAVAFPALASATKRVYKTTDAGGVAAAMQRYVSTFDEIDAVLARQTYLGGDSPNRLDITLAALLGPVCAPPEHRVKWPPLPSQLADLDQRGRPTWDHVLRMYREHRKPRHASAVPA